MWISKNRKRLNESLFYTTAILISAVSSIVIANTAYGAATISEELYKHLKTGYELVEKGAYDRAVKAFCQAVRADRDSITARRYLAYALLKSGVPDLALEQLSLISRMTTPNAFDFFLYGEAYYGMGQYKEAFGAFQKSLTAMPEFDAARGGVIKSLTLQGEFHQATNECVAGLNQAKNEASKKYYKTMLQCVKDISARPVSNSYPTSSNSSNNQLDLGRE